MIRASREVALVEYQSGTGLRRCYVPRGEVIEGRVVMKSLEAGLEYGVDLTETMPHISLDPSEFQKEARRRGLWTLEDYRSKSNILKGLLMQMLGWSLAAVIRAAEKAEER